MAVKTCSPGTSLDWSAGALWGGSAPADDDIVVFTTPGVYQFTTGFSQSAIELQALYVDDGCNLIFDGGTMAIDVSNTTTDDYPTLTILGSVTGTLDGDFSNIVNYGVATNMTITGTTKTTARCLTQAGTIAFDTGVVVTALHCLGDAEVTLQANATELVRLSVESRAQVKSYRSIESADTSDRAVLRYLGAATVADGASGGELNLYGYSTVYFQGTASAADTIRAVGPCTIDWTGKVGDITVAVLEQSASAVVPTSFPGGTVTTTAKIPLGPSNTPPYTGKG